MLFIYEYSKKKIKSRIKRIADKDDNPTLLEKIAVLAEQCGLEDLKEKL